MATESAECLEGPQPPRIFAHPMEGRFSRERRKEDEVREKTNRRGVHLERALAQAGWDYYWDEAALKLVEVVSDASWSGAGNTLDAGQAKSRASAMGGKGYQGPEEEEIKAAVAAAATSEDSNQLHDAATVLREASSMRCEEAHRKLLRLEALPALLRLLTRDDAALQEDAAISLYNTCQYPFMQERVTHEGGLASLSAALKSVALPSTKANIAAALSLLTRTEANSAVLVTWGVLPALLDMLQTATNKARPDAPKTPSLLKFPSLSSSGDTSVRDACNVLMRLATFKPIRVALLQQGAVPKCADVAAVAGLTGATSEVAALLALLTRVEGGAEKVCLEDNGRAALALADLALSDNPAAQDLAVGALGQAARDKPECCAALRALQIPEKLLSEYALQIYHDQLREKVEKVATFMMET